MATTPQTKPSKNKTKKVVVEDILRTLCRSVTAVLGAATNKPVKHSSMVQRIQKN